MSYGISLKRNWMLGKLVVGTALLALASGVNAATVSVLAENFDNVTGANSSSATQDVCTNNTCSTIASGLTLGSLATKEATSIDDINVRRGDNVINTNPGVSGFNSFFGSTSANRFLVLGDTEEGIGGSPVAGTLFFSIPFTIAGGNTALFSFDWAFDGTDSSSSRQDIFSVFIKDSTGATTLFDPSFSKTSNTDLGTTGTATFNWTGFTVDTTYRLYFELNEATSISGDGATDTAVGLDNIQVSAVPLPPAVWLLCSALVGLCTISRRREPGLFVV